MKKFQLTIIGSGTMMPTKARHPSCYLLELGRQKILLDLGHTSISRLVDQGIDLHSIDTLFVSHFHTDHFADVLPFIHSRWVDDIHHPGKKHKELTIIGPKSIEERWRKLREVFWVEPQEHYPLKFIEGVQTVEIDEIQIELFEVTHVQWYQSLGIKINFQNKSFVYTGDIGGNHDFQNLKQIVQNINLLLVESECIKPTPNHFTIDQIIEIVNDCNVKKVVATHLRDVNLPILKEKIKNHDNIILAKDLMKIKI
jgi:ribonuclease BN (tRNA processing enzyme)